MSVISWIPSEAIRGLPNLPFQVGITHIDEPPPGHIDDVARLVENQKLRFANVLEAWIDVDERGIVGYGCEGGGIMGSSVVGRGTRTISLPGISLPDLRPDPIVTAESVTWRQTAGGRPALPAPRRVKHRPFVQLRAPVVWTTLELELLADGTAEGRLVGSSPFPRHWVYDASGDLVAKSGLIDFDQWYHHAFGGVTPWEAVDRDALTTEVESELERHLSRSIMGSEHPTKRRRLRAGEVLFRQGEEGSDLFLVLDGVASVEVDGKLVAEIGPGAVMGERAVLEGGRRTATVTAVTPLRGVVVPPEVVEPEHLEQLSGDHRREEEGGGDPPEGS
ncbi:MAG: cyclic nucleotide-binding domain-containing protein [Actinomycetota bacterium]